MTVTRRIARAVIPERLRDVYHQAQSVADQLADIRRDLARIGLTLAAQVHPADDLSLAAREIKVFSQNGEDGLLLWLFDTIGTTDRRFVEFGVGDGHECNTRYLAEQRGWTGLRIEGSDELGAEARRIATSGVTVTSSYVTAENINDIIGAAGLGGEIDLLSVDIDGNDYWLWKAITVIKPRVVVVEYNASFGPTAKVRPDYDPNRIPDFGYKMETALRWGSSLAALTDLGADLGYSPIGCDSAGVNAFFVRDDCTRGLKTVDAATGWVPSARWTAKHLQAGLEQIALG